MNKLNKIIILSCLLFTLPAQGTEETGQCLGITKVPPPSKKEIIEAAKLPSPKSFERLLAWDCSAPEETAKQIREIAFQAGKEKNWNEVEAVYCRYVRRTPSEADFKELFKGCPTCGINEEYNFYCVLKCGYPFLAKNPLVTIPVAEAKARAERCSRMNKEAVDFWEKQSQKKYAATAEKELKVLNAKGAAKSAKEWEERCALFAKAHYAGGPVSDEESYEILPVLSPKTAVTSQKAKLFDSEIERLQKIFKERKFPSWVTVLSLKAEEVTVWEATLDLKKKEVGHLVSFRAEKGDPNDPSHNKGSLAEGVAWISSKEVVEIIPFAYHQEAFLDGESSFKNYELLDVADVDGNGIAEILITVNGWEDHSISVYSIENGKATQRWNGGGYGL